MIIAILSIILCLFLIKQIKRISSGGFLNLFYSFFYTLELSIALILVAFDDGYKLYNGIFLSETLPSFGLACVLANLGIYFGQRLSNYFFKRGINLSLNERINKLSEFYNLNIVSLYFLVLFSFTIISSLDIAYYIAVLALSFSFSTALIGLIWAKLNRFNKFLWIFALGVNFIFHAVQGSRGTALFPIIFLVIGYMISIKENKRLFKRQLITYSFIAFISFPILSLISDFRTIQGRGLEVNMDNIEMLWNIGLNYKSNEKDDGEELRSSLGRMLIEANPAAVFMTPDRVDYRYDDSMMDEVISIVSLAGDSGREINREERGNAGYGTGVATRYGFAVNATTSVEWPVFADSYSRFGYIGLFVYSFAFAMFFSYLEKFTTRLWKRNQLLSMILMLFILYNGVLSYMYSYYALMKVLVFRMTLVWIVTQFISLFTKRHTINKLVAR